MGCVNSTTFKSVNAVTQAFGHKITNWSRPRGFDSGRSLFAKIQNGDAAALCCSATLIEEVVVTQPVRIFSTRRMASRRPRPGAKYGAGAAILLRGPCTSQSLIVHTYGSCHLPALELPYS
jgi:hypothetical protein